MSQNTNFISEIIALFALLIAAWSALQTGRFNRRQNKFDETAEKLNNLLIEREKIENETCRQADLGANFVKVGNSNFRLKVFNRGSAPAKNVRFEILKGDGLLSEQELNQKFPLPLLDKQQGLELICYFSNDSSRRAHLKLIWDDDAGTNRSKELWVDVF